MFKRFRMKFTYRYIINEGAAICFAVPAMENLELKKYTELYIRLKGEKPKEKIPAEFKGIARLKAADTSDIEAAKAIARSKAVRSAFKAYRRYVNEIYRAFYREVTDLYGFAATIYQKIVDVQNDINELIAP